MITYRLYYNLPTKLGELDFKTEGEMREEARKMRGLVLGHKLEDDKVLQVYHL